jgi:hypothetical protein
VQTEGENFLEYLPIAGEKLESNLDFIFTFGIIALV